MILELTLIQLSIWKQNLFFAIWNCLNLAAHV